MRRQRGVTLVEAIVAVAVLAITALAVNQFYSTTLKSTRSAEVITVRDQLYEFATQAINPESLFNSIQQGSDENNFLRNCVRPDTGVDCIHTNPDPDPDPNIAGQQGFHLMTPEPGGGAIVIAGPGTLTLPQWLYDNAGEPGCTSNCRYRINAYFWATCAPLTNGTFPASCPSAETIWVRIRVTTLNPGGPARQGTLNVNDTPPATLFESNPTQFAFPVATKDIRLIEESSCILPGTRMTGYDRFGQPICRCATNCTCDPVMQTINGQEIDTTFGDCGRRGPPTTCFCAESVCDPRIEFMAGLDQNNQAICIRRDSLELCEQINIQTNGDCGEGRQMVNVTYGSCSHSRDPKGGGWEISCEDDTATCCSNTF